VAEDYTAGSDLWLPPADLVVPESDKLRLFRDFAGTLVSQQKTLIVVERFQEVCLADHFAGTPITTIIQPKKLGKSTIVAAVALFHALVTDDCDVIIVAVSKDQAKIIFRHCRGFIMRSAGKALDLNDHFDVKDGFNEIRSRRDLGRIRVMAADDQTLEGVEPTLGLVDEYGQHKTSGAYDPLNDGMDTRGGQLLVISNAGADEEGPLGRQRARMLKHVQAREGAYTYCRTPDGSEVLHEFALKGTDDWEDLDVVKTANPASWMTREKLARRLESRSTVARWQRYACGIWVRGDEAAIMPWEWDDLPREAIPAKAPVFVGLDVAFSGGKGDKPTDTTALTPHHWTADGRRVFGTPIILEPPPGDGRLDDRAITAALERLAGTPTWDRDDFEHELAADNDRADVKRWADAIEAADPYRVQAVIYDPNGGAEQLINAFKRSHRGIKFVEFEQKPSVLARADARFMEALRQKQLGHTGHALMRQHVLDAVEKPVTAGFYFDHPQRPRKPQDALRAASMAHDAAVASGGTGRARGSGIHFA
jgi:hypothetical protein